MKIFVIANTKFGFRNRTTDQLDYFYNFFIPFLKKNTEKDSILIHLGNILNNKNSINIKILNDVYILLDDISSIINIKLIKGPSDIFSHNIFSHIKNIEIYQELEINNNLFFNSDYLIELEKYSNYKKCFCGFYEKINNIENIIDVTSPYQLTKDSINGFYIIDQDDIQFVKNDYSPIFREIEIKSTDDLKLLEDYKKDILDIKINSDLMNKKEIANFISNYKVNSIFYSDEKTEDFSYKIEIQDSNIRNILKKYINENNLELNDEMERVFHIRDRK